MSVTIIKTKDRKPWRARYQALEAKYFANDDFPFNGNAFVGWRESPFHIINVGVDGEAVKSLTTMIVTTQGEMQKLIDGKALEHEIKPYTPGDNQLGYLFWLSLVVEDKTQAPYLIKSSFRELEDTMRAWKLNISHVFAIAYTKVSERLMKRYGFTQAGLYQGHYPIMAIKVTDNAYLKAFIPYIRIESTPPWVGGTAHPIPDITPKPKA